MASTRIASNKIQKVFRISSKTDFGMSPILSDEILFQKQKFYQERHINYYVLWHTHLFKCLVQKHIYFYYLQLYLIHFNRSRIHFNSNKFAPIFSQTNL